MFFQVAEQNWDYLPSQLKNPFMCLFLQVLRSLKRAGFMALP